MGIVSEWVLMFSKGLVLKVYTSHHIVRILRTLSVSLVFGIPSASSTEISKQQRAEEEELWWNFGGFWSFFDGFLVYFWMILVEFW